MPRPAVILALTAALVAAGCTQTRGHVTDASRFSYHRDPAIEQIRRVVVMPLHRARGVGRSAEALDRAVPAAWRELGTFEVIGATEAERDELMPSDAFRTRSIDAEELRRVSTAFNADAVILGRIEHFDSFDPVSIGLEMALVSCYDGSVLWTASGHFDGSRAAIQEDIEDWYHDAGGAHNASVAGWRATLHSPRRFARYVADRTAVSTLDPEVIAQRGARAETGSKGGDPLQANRQ